MKLGDMLGGKAWGDMARAAAAQRKTARQKREDERREKQRRADLEAMGFRPLNVSKNS